MRRAPDESDARPPRGHGPGAGWLPHFGPRGRVQRSRLSLVAPRQPCRRDRPHEGRSDARRRRLGSSAGVGVVPEAGGLRRHRHHLCQLRQRVQPVRRKHPRGGLGPDAQAHEARGGLRSVRRRERDRRGRHLLRRRRPVRLRARLEGHARRGRRQRRDRAWRRDRRHQRRPGDPRAVPVRRGEGHDPVGAGDGGLLREEDHAGARHARGPHARVRDHRHALHAAGSHGPSAHVHGAHHHRRLGVPGQRGSASTRTPRRSSLPTARRRSSVRGTCRS